MDAAHSSVLLAASVLETLIESLGEHLSARQAWVLLRIASARTGWLDQREISAALGSTSAARIVQSLSDSGWRRNAAGDRLPGAGLIESHVDPHDRRLRRLTLTAAGRRLLEQFEETE